MFKIRFKRVVACVLMICIIFSLNVSFASAETDDNELDTEQAVDLEKANVTRVEEVISMREANSKTYQLSDGSYQYVGYAEDIHYADSNGDLQEIDNEITSNTGRSNYLYTNTANSWKMCIRDSPLSIAINANSLSLPLATLSFSSHSLISSHKY